VLERLDEVDWASLTHAYGPAADVPDQLRALASADAGTREHALRELYGNIFHQGTRYEASSEAVPFLVELAGSPDVAARDEIIALLVALAVGYDEAWLPRGIAIDRWRAAAAEMGGEDAVMERYALDAYDAVRAGLPLFRELVYERDEALAASAAYSLAWFPEEADASRRVLGERLRSDPPPVVASAAMIALALLGGGSDDAERRLADDTQLVRAAAAIAVARARTADVPDNAVDVLAEAAAAEVRDVRVLFFEGDLSQYAAVALAGLPVAVAERAIDSLLQGLERVRFPRAATYASALLEIAFGEQPAPLWFSALSQLQQRVVRGLATAPRAWMPEEDTYDANFAAAVSAYGLPADPDAFRAYAGLPPFERPRRGLRRLFR
jgi:hypothetical protein